MKFYLQKRLINFLVKHLFNGITEEDILRLKRDGSVLYKNQPLKKEVIMQIRDEAERFHNSLLWKVLSDDVKYQANQRMFFKGHSESDLYVGKAILHAIELLENKIEQIRRLK